MIKTTNLQFGSTKIQEQLKIKAHNATKIKGKTKENGYSWHLNFFIQTKLPVFYSLHLQ
jgi:hypothetical protein